MDAEQVAKKTTMHDGRESGAAEPYSYTNNERVRLERSLNSISQLINAFTQLGNEDLDGRIANGLAVALEKLADESQGLYSREEVENLGGVH
jgi:hypothetical protein